MEVVAVNGGGGGGVEGDSGGGGDSSGSDGVTVNEMLQIDKKSLK